MRRWLAAATVALLAAGCHDPVRDPYRPDPSPVQIVRASLPPVGFFPDNRASFQWLPAGADAKTTLLACLQAAAGGGCMIETDLLTDMDVVAALRTLAGSEAWISVVLDDGDDGQMTANKPAFDALRASSIGVQTPQHPSGSRPLAFTRERARSMSLELADGTVMLMVFGAPLTPEGFAAAMPAVIDLTEDDGYAAESARGLAMSGAALTQQSPRLAEGPGLVRNDVDSWLAGAKTSVQLAAGRVADAAVVARLQGLAAKGVTVQVLLGAGGIADRPGLGELDVRVAPGEVPAVLVVDGKLAVVGAGALDTAGLDHDRQEALALDDADAVAGAKGAFAHHWGLGS